MYLLFSIYAAFAHSVTGLVEHLYRRALSGHLYRRALSEQYQPTVRTPVPQGTCCVSGEALVLAVKILTCKAHSVQASLVAIICRQYARQYEQQLPG